MIELINLTKSYNKRVTVFKNFSYSFSSNLCLVIGSNGSGKTTLLNCITDYIRYTGKISYKGVISYLPEIRNFDEDVVTHDLINLICNLYGNNVNEYISKFKFNEFMNRKISELSKGNKTKLFILCTLAKPAEAYLFDEPTDGLDIDAKEEFIRFCMDLSKQHIVVISTHDLGVIDRLKQEANLLDLSKVEKCLEK